MAKRIALHTGQSEERIVADFDRDRWFTADEAREYGMIDAVLDHRSQLRSLRPTAPRKARPESVIGGDYRRSPWGPSHLTA